MKLTKVLFLLIISAAFFLRFYNIDKIPPALYQDETSIGYNAYSILETQKDEYGKTFPLYFKSFGDQKLPVYIYLTAISESIFGVNEFAVRFPSAFFGAITVLVFYFLIRQISGKENLALLSSALLTFNPWHLHFSRAGFEVNIALFFALLGALFFILGINKKKFLILSFSVISFALSLYSYNVTRILSPLLLFTLIFAYREKFLALGRIRIFSFFLIFIALLSPFLIKMFSSEGVFSAKGALITSTDIEAQLVELRSYYLFLPAFFTKIFFNKYIFIGWTYILNIAGIFSPKFYFISGTAHGSQGIGNVGHFYIFEFPLIVLGIYKVISTRPKWFIPFAYWLIATILVLALSKEVPHATRGYFLIIPFTVLSAYGAINFIDFMKKRPRAFYLPLSLISGAIIVYSLIFYFTSYYFRFPMLYAKSWRTADRDLSFYLKNNLNKYDKVLIDKNSGFMYSSFLFYSKFPPETFQSTVEREPDDSEGFSNVVSFGKFTFKNINWEEDSKEKKSLIITAFNDKPINSPVLKIFYYPTLPIVLSLKEEIKQYPLQEPAYVLIETN